jgi:hypothetical protein
MRKYLRHFLGQVSASFIANRSIADIVAHV